MKDISIEITESPLIDTTIPVLDNITDLVGDSFQFTKAAMGGMIAASLNMTTDAVTAWDILTRYVGKRLAFTSPHAKNTNAYSAPVVWDGMVYTVRIEIDGATVSRSMENVYNAIDVQYTEIIGINAGPQRITTVLTDARSIATYGKRRLRSSAGTMEATDADYLCDVMIKQYKDALSTAVGTNKRNASRYMPPMTQNQIAKVGIDCVGYWEFFDKTFYSNSDTSAIGVAEIVEAIYTAVHTENPGVIAYDYTFVNTNPLSRTQFFNPDQTITAKNALELCCSIGDGSSSFSWITGLGPHRFPYYRVMDFTQKYVTQLADPSGVIYDVASGEAVPPYLIEPGYLIWTNDLLPDAIVFTEGTHEARNQMIDTVTFAAPNAVTWSPRLAADQVNLKLSRLGVGYFDNAPYPWTFIPS